MSTMGLLWNSLVVYGCTMESSLWRCCPSCRRSHIPGTVMIIMFSHHSSILAERPPCNPDPSLNASGLVPILEPGFQPFNHRVDRCPLPAFIPTDTSGTTSFSLKIPRRRNILYNIPVDIYTGFTWSYAHTSSALFATLVPASNDLFVLYIVKIYCF